MKKNLIALAVTTLIATPAAFADVEVGSIAIYGTFHTAVEMITLAKNGAAVAKTEDSQTRLADQGSKLGFKTKLDLGNGNFALGQMESRFYIGNNGNNSDDKAELGGRNTFVGVGSSDVGTLRLGRYDNAYKLSSKQMGPLRDNLNDASDDTGDKQILNRLGARQGDLIAYESPNWGGFTALFSYNFGKDSTGSISGGSAANTAKFTPATDLMNQMSIGLGYKSGNFAVGLGTTSVNNASWQLDTSSSADAKTTAGATQELGAYQLGASYKMGDFRIGAVTERTASKLNSAAKSFDQNQTTTGLVLGYKSGAFNVEARYAMADDVSGNLSTGALAKETGSTQYGLAMAYQLHKNVQLVGSITSIDNKKNASYTSASGFKLGKGVDMQQIAVGIAATF